MNMMTLVPKLSHEEKVWCMFLWSQHTNVSVFLEPPSPQKIMLMEREALLKRAKALHISPLRTGWTYSLSSLIEKLKDEHDDAHTEADR